MRALGTLAIVANTATGVDATVELLATQSIAEEWLVALVAAHLALSRAAATRPGSYGVYILREPDRG